MDSVSNNGLGMDFQNLISCIHWHEDSKDGQVILETLKTITNICTNEECGRDAFREAGGLDFLVEFMFTTNNTVFLEHSLKTLACVIDENAHNQIYMTKNAVFEVIQTILQNKTFPIVIKKNAILLISAILYRNSAAQNLICEVGLLQDLLQAYEQGAQRLLLANTYASNSEDTSNELWISSNSVLGSAVNNPVNEKNQAICSSVFSISLRVLEACFDFQIIRSVSAFLSLCISNNKYCQDKFSEYDGLQVSKRLLQKYYDLILDDVKDCNNVIRRGTLQVLGNIIGIISAAASEHERNSALFGQLGVLTLMVNLLFVKTLDIKMKTKVLLSLGHTVVACGANKTYVLNTENFDNLLKEYLQVGNAELSSACKCLLQICLLNEEVSSNKDNTGVEVVCDIKRYDGLTKSEFENQSSDFKKLYKVTKKSCSIKRPNASISKSEDEFSLKNELNCCDNIDSSFKLLAKKVKTDGVENDSKSTAFKSYDFFPKKNTQPIKSTTRSTNTDIADSKQDFTSTTQHSDTPKKSQISFFDIESPKKSDDDSDSSDSQYYPCETLLEIAQNTPQQNKNEKSPLPEKGLFHSNCFSPNQTPSKKSVRLASPRNIRDENKLNISINSSRSLKRPILNDSTNFEEQPSEKMFKLDPVFKSPSREFKHLWRSPRSPNCMPSLACTPSRICPKELDRSHPLKQSDLESCGSSKSRSAFRSLGHKRSASVTSSVTSEKAKKRKGLPTSTIQGTHESPSEFNEDNSSNCVQVVVFSGEKCDEHDLISSFETLEVVPLNEYQRT